MLEQEPLHRQPAAEPGERAVGADDAVAREDERQRVLAVRRSDGAGLLRAEPEPARLLAVADRLAVRDRREREPAATLELAALAGRAAARTQSARRRSTRRAGRRLVEDRRRAFGGETMRVELHACEPVARWRRGREDRSGYRGRSSPCPPLQRVGTTWREVKGRERPTLLSVGASPHHRRRQLSAARLAHRPRPARRPAAAARPGARALAQSPSRSSRRRRTTRPGSRSRTWSGPASTSSPTARCGARATRTASRRRSTASTSTSRASRSTAPATRTRSRASSARSAGRDPVEVRDVEFLRSLTDRRIKITVPGPFTMTQQAQNDHYGDERALALAYADAVNEELRDLKAAGADVVQIDEPYLQARPEAARELRDRGDRPRARRTSTATRSSTRASATRTSCTTSRTAIRSSRELDALRGRPICRSRRRSRASTRSARRRADKIDRARRARPRHATRSRRRRSSPRGSSARSTVIAAASGSSSRPTAG